MIIDNEHKKCRVCKEIKNISEFHKKKKSPLNCKNECKECVKELQKKYKTPEFRIKQQKYCKEWRLNNKSISQDRKDYIKEWRILNKDKIKLQNKEYSKNNRARLNEIDKPKRKIRYYKRLKEPLFRIKESVRCSIRRTIKSKGIKKNLKTEIILGCTYLEFKKHLESKFENWMNYENYGKYNGEFNYGWDIDHIIPASTAKTEEEIIKLNHYTNLAPLCSKINRDIKRDNLDFYE